jgi:hypothetical protein
LGSQLLKHRTRQAARGRQALGTRGRARRERQAARDDPGGSSIKQITDHMTGCRFWLHVCIWVDHGFECAGIIKQIAACLVDVAVLAQPTEITNLRVDFGVPTGIGIVSFVNEIHASTDPFETYN